jgi:hypothetical protein
MPNINFMLHNKGSVATSTSQLKEVWVLCNVHLSQNFECGVLSVSSDLMVVYDETKYVGLVFISEDLALYEATFVSSPDLANSLFIIVVTCDSKLNQSCP